MMHLGKPRRVKAIAVVTAFVLTVVSIGIGGSVFATSESASIFEADFSGLANGTVSTTDADTVAALEKNFYFYNSQRADQTSHTSYFERNEVNGYLVLGEDESSKPKYPDTGVSPAWDLDGYGKAADKPIPMWSIQDGWLSCSTYDGEDAFLFRQGNLLYVKDSTTVSGFAAVKNFSLEMDFKFSSTAENDALGLIFHARDAGLAAHPFQNMLAFNADGKLVFGKVLGASLNFQSPINYNDQLKTGNGSALKLEKDHAYTLSLKVIGTKLTLVIRDGKTELCTYAADDLYVTGAENGYLAIGISNNGPAIADVRVQRLDDAGTMVDFNAQMPGYSFGFTGTTLCDYRTYYYADLGGGPQLIEGNYYSRDLGRELYWYDFWSLVRHGDPAWVGIGMNYADDRLTEMFATYHEQISVSTRKRLFGKSDKYSDRIGAELTLGDGQTSAQGYIATGNRLLLLGDPLEHKLLSQIMTIAPKTESGEQIITKNLETSFGAILFNDPEKAITLSFRSGSSGAMLKDDASGGYADKVTIVLSGAGYRIFDGESMAVSGNSLTPWDGGAVFNGENAHVYVKAVGNKLTLKVTNDAGRVYLDTTNAPTTLSTVHEGYCYFSSLDGYGYFLYMGLSRLTDNGQQGDINKNPSIEVVRADYTTVNATIDRASGQSLNDVQMQSEIACTTKEGYTLNVSVRWESDDYRSYKDGTFDFKAVPLSSDITFTRGSQPTAKIVNKINGDFDTVTSRKYYFDSENDFKDFVCHKTSVDIPATGTTTEVKMNKVDPLQCWAIRDGKAEAIYSRTINGGWNGLNRASDVSTMVLADDNMALLNFQVEVDFTHGTGWYPYMLVDVQDPAQFFGDVNINRNALNLTNGDGTDLVFTDKTKQGGVWAFLEREGCFNFWGAVQGDRWGRVYYDTDITDGQDFIKTYDPTKQHHMTIRVVNGVVSMQVDTSDVYYASLDDAILGGYIGFGACGTHNTYDNLTITALDELGDPISLADADKGFTPTPVPDDYTGWQPFETDWAFDWKAPYTFD